MLATLYKLMHKAITGVGLLGHHLELDIEEGIKGYDVNKPPVDVEAVEGLVEILLQEKAVNLTWVADSVEKQIYTNVIVVGFGVVQTFLDSFCIDIYEYPNQKGVLPRSSVTWEEALAMCEKEGKHVVVLLPSSSSSSGKKQPPPPAPAPKNLF